MLASSQLKVEKNMKKVWIFLMKFARLNSSSHSEINYSGLHKFLPLLNHSTFCHVGPCNWNWFHLGFIAWLHNMCNSIKLEQLVESSLPRHNWINTPVPELARVLLALVTGTVLKHTTELSNYDLDEVLEFVVLLNTLLRNGKYMTLKKALIRQAVMSQRVTLSMMLPPACFTVGMVLSG